MRQAAGLCCLVLAFAVLDTRGAESRPFESEAHQSLRRAVAFYRTHVAQRGGYVYYYSTDLSRRWGEGRAAASQIWVQPPGTPTVGSAFLKAYEATGDPFYRDAADEAAEALLFGQLQSGGWEHAIDFDPEGGRSGQYRNGKGRGKNYSTLDDDVTQSALRFLMRLDRAHDFANTGVHEAVMYGLDALLKAQFPNGGFPQVWKGPVEPHPIVEASYPHYDWRTENRIKEYWNLYTLNDNLGGDVAETLVLAHDVYGGTKYRETLARLGDFLLLSQMPDPQPAWCQQYNFDMNPAWARKFEPPAIATSESIDVIRALMTIYEATGDRNYLEPIPRALAYLERSRLPDGRLPRYLELRTNKPLYMKRDGKAYHLTYDDSKLPSHYGFKIEADLDGLRKQYTGLKQGKRRDKLEEATDPPSQQRVREIVSSLDEDGRWVTVHDDRRLVGQPKFESGYRYISSAVFAQNVKDLSAYLATLSDDVLSGSRQSTGGAEFTKPKAR